MIAVCKNKKLRFINSQTICPQDGITSVNNNFVYYFKSQKILLFITLVCIFGNYQNASAQQYPQQSAYVSPGQQPQNYLKNSAAFRQEIMRMEINVDARKSISPHYADSTRAKR